jgi:hypothetical protein
MEFMGFSTIWQEWVSVLLSSASTKVLMNGLPGEQIYHFPFAKGTRSPRSCSYW